MCLKKEKETVDCRRRDLGDLAIFNEETFPSTAILAEIFWITRELTNFKR